MRRDLIKKTILSYTQKLSKQKGKHRHKSKNTITPNRLHSGYFNKFIFNGR